MKLEVLEYQREYWKKKVENMNKPGYSSPTQSLQEEPNSPEHENDELWTKTLWLVNSELLNEQNEQFCLNQKRIKIF